MTSLKIIFGFTLFCDWEVTDPGNLEEVVEETSRDSFNTAGKYHYRLGWGHVCLSAELQLNLGQPCFSYMPNAVNNSCTWMNIWTHVHANLPMCADSQDIHFKDKQIMLKE